MSRNISIFHFTDACFSIYKNTKENSFLYCSLCLDYRTMRLGPSLFQIHSSLQWRILQKSLLTSVRESKTWTKTSMFCTLSMYINKHTCMYIHILCIIYVMHVIDTMSEKETLADVFVAKLSLESFFCFLSPHSNTSCTELPYLWEMLRTFWVAYAGLRNAGGSFTTSSSYNISILPLKVRHCMSLSFSSFTSYSFIILHQTLLFPKHTFSLPLLNVINPRKSSSSPLLLIICNKMWNKPVIKFTYTMFYWT